MGFPPMFCNGEIDAMSALVDGNAVCIRSEEPFTN
jgi:hypothetical protein